MNVVLLTLYGVMNSGLQKLKKKRLCQSQQTIHIFVNLNLGDYKASPTNHA